MLRAADPGLSAEAAGRRAEVIVTAELAYRAYLDGRPWDHFAVYAAALLGVQVADLEVAALSVTGFRRFVPRLQDQRGYFLTDPARLVDAIGLDPHRRDWTDSHRPHLSGLDQPLNEGNTDGDD